MKQMKKNILLYMLLVLMNRNKGPNRLLRFDGFGSLGVISKVANGIFLGINLAMKGLKFV